MKSKTNKILIPIIAVLSAVLIFFLGFFTRELTYSSLKKTALNILDKYEKYYYYESDDVIGVISDAIFDKYSTYMTKEEYQLVTENAYGRNQGIGVSFAGSSLKISNVLYNSPCDKAGVKAGGTVVAVKIDGVDKPFSDYQGLFNILDGTNIGSTVSLSVDYSGEITTYDVVKSIYKRSYVTYIDNSGTYSFIDDGGMKLCLRNIDGITLPKTAYIRYDQFSGKGSGTDGSVGQLKSVLSKFSSNENKNLILDLRNNGGGDMKILSEVAGLFVEKESDNQVLCLSKDKYQKETKFYIKNSLYSTYGFEKIIVLANQNTASASEVLIGAMLDYDTQNKLTVVLDGFTENGQTTYRTYGKGIMQTTYLNVDGSAVKLTTAKMFWPKSNISIHGIGVTENTSSKVKNATNGDAYQFALNLLNN